jgi:alkylhydroperoxidase family enzyme
MYHVAPEDSMAPIPRLAAPRVPPLPADRIDPEIRERLSGPGPAAGLNIFRTLAHHPKLLKRWLVFGSHVLGRSTLSPRQRELVILRIGFLCRAPYEWGQHVLIARGSGLSHAEIDRIPLGPDAPATADVRWNELERALLRATDELRADAMIGDATWAALAKELSVEQLLDLIFTVGQYNLVSMALNSLGVQPEPGLPAFPEP